METIRSESVIRCWEVTKYYPIPPPMRSILRPSAWRARKLVLDRITFEVAPGEVLGIVGPNGAGKTTMLKILSHLTSPSAGTASVCGHDVERDWHRAVRCIGYCISEERSFFWRLSGRQNLLFFADMLQVPPRTARARIGELFEMLDLAQAADDRFMSYSSGMKQKMAIARSLLASPRILLMDEPTRGLDPRAAARLRSFIESYISSEGRAAIITTNQIVDLENLCARLVILDHGEIVARGTLDEIRSFAAQISGAGEAISFEHAFTAIIERHERSIAGEQRG